MLNTLYAAVLVAILGLGGYAYYEHTQVALLTSQMVTYKSAAEIAQGELDKATKSCATTETIVTKNNDAIAAINASQQATGAAIITLPTLTIKETANAKPAASQSFTKYADDDRLSPELMQLLDTAYCYGDKDGCSSATK